MNAPIGFVGLGRMGRPMAGHLAAAGHAVLGHDRLPAAREALAGSGVTAVTDLAALAGACRVVILMLPDSAAVDALLWQEGLAAGLASGALVIDMGSSDPARTRENHRRLAQAGIDLLAIMVGGEAAALERARPLLQRLGATVAHVGPPGAGHALKALNNFVSASGLLAVCEALGAAQRFGIDPAAANALFNASSGRNNTTETKVAQFMLSGSFGSGFSLALMRKDIETARGLMHGLGVPHDFVDACADIWSQAERSLPAGVDHTEMYRHVLGGVPPADRS